ncbi:thioredoxin [Candidatus Shapirobacteria bacterium]|nr:thioredoxin [Candidatus Shapirobacteria bacterium]
MAVIDLTDASFEEKVLQSKIPVLVDFWAPWCLPCRMAGPVIDELAETYKDKLLVAKLNIDENPATAAKYQVMSIPTMILFKGRKEIKRIVGFSGKEEIKAEISNDTNV